MGDSKKNIDKAVEGSFPASDPAEMCVINILNFMQYILYTNLYTISWKFVALCIVHYITIVLQYTHYHSNVSR